MKAFTVSLAVAVLMAGCGAGKSEPTAKPPTAAQATPAASKQADLPPEKPAEEPKPTRTASETLLLPDQMYSLAFSSSEAGVKAEELCQKKHAKNPQKKNQCMKLERGKLKDDVLQFSKDDRGFMFLTTSEQRGNLLKRRKKVGFKVVKETENTVEIKLKGAAKSLIIKVPNDYSIEVPDPKHGILVYESKMDIDTDD